MVMILGLLQNPTFTNLHCWVPPWKCANSAKTPKCGRRDLQSAQLWSWTSSSKPPDLRLWLDADGKFVFPPQIFSQMVGHGDGMVMHPMGSLIRKKSSNKNKSKTLPWIHSRHIQRNMGRGCGPLFLGYTSSHNHGSQKWVPPIGSLPFKYCHFPLPWLWEKE